MICKHFANNILKQAWAYFSSQLNDFIYLHAIQIIQFPLNHLCVHSQTVLSTAMYEQQFNISHLFINL